eukprot:519669-Hanusia_phi.AAC.1
MRKRGGGESEKEKGGGGRVLGGARRIHHEVVGDLMSHDGVVAVLGVGPDKLADPRAERQVKEEASKSNTRRQRRQKLE